MISDSGEIKGVALWTTDWPIFFKFQTLFALQSATHPDFFQ